MENAIRKMALGAALLFSAVSSQALVIDSIDMTVKATSASPTHTLGDYQSAFGSASAIANCTNVALTAFDLVGGPQSCGSTNTNIATWFTLDITQTENAIDWQFGADFGKGFFVFATDGGAGHVSDPSDVWWAKDWNNADVFNFTTSNGLGDDLTLNFLGFENGGSGPMSLRYREGDGEWTTAAVNSVPEPGSLALLGLGLAGLGLSRRKAKA